MFRRTGMSKLELIAQEVEGLPEQDFDRLLGFVWTLKEARAERLLPMVVAESSLAKDWLTPEEDEAWAGL
jgi:hypothetical protein